MPINKYSNNNKMARESHTASFMVSLQKGSFDLQDHGDFKSRRKFFCEFEFLQFSRTKVSLLSYSLHDVRTF